MTNEGLRKWVATPLGLWRDRQGQDLIEYALTAAFVAVAVAVIFPVDIVPNISTIFWKVVTILDSAPPQG